MYSKKGKSTTDFSQSSFANKVSITLECPYCGHVHKTAFDSEMGENKKRLAITWKCPKCGEYSKIYDWKLHALEEDGEAEE